MKVLQNYKQKNQVSSASDAMKALGELGVSKNFLSSMGGLAKNPIVSGVASLCGVSTDKIQEDVQKLNGPGPTSDLDQFKEDLAKL